MDNRFTNRHLCLIDAVSAEKAELILDLSLAAEPQATAIRREIDFCEWLLEQFHLGEPSHRQHLFQSSNDADPRAVVQQTLKLVCGHTGPDLELGSAPERPSGRSGH